MDFDLYTKKEDLCQELMPYLSYHDKLKQDVIKHPLVFSVPHNSGMNAIVNEMLRQRKAASKEFLELKKYNSYIWIHERPYRLQAFAEVAKHLDDKEYWEILSDIWTDSENIWQNRPYWKGLLADRKETKEFFMSEEDKLVYDQLPETITIYRGYIPGKNKLGFSYTLDKDKAEWFSKRYWKDGLVLTRTVKKSDVFAYTNNRNEQEIIILK